MVSAGEPKKVSKKIVAPVFSFARRKTGPQGIQDTFINPKLATRSNWPEIFKMLKARRKFW